MWTKSRKFNEHLDGYKRDIAKKNIAGYHQVAVTEYRLMTNIIVITRFCTINDFWSKRYNHVLYYTRSIIIKESFHHFLQVISFLLILIKI